MLLNSFGDSDKNPHLISKNNKMVKKYKETYLFTHGKINIFVKIDYHNNKITLVEPVTRSSDKFKPKNWLFQDRGVEFMDSWQNILNAMKEAVYDAKKRLEEYKEEEMKKVDKQLEELLCI